ncbi:MAG TPA: helicase-related protein [Dysgonamonadaceae bacterium]|nr:helicase-related protein [Dysgonamonadaceae bacterium]HRU13563.1 helicase-related protein [Dysgonamonadaceae bacterium]
MAQIYDNIQTRFTEGLKGIISNSQVRRVDFCVGYFNLRGWEMVVNEVDSLPGSFVFENDNNVFRTCRLLIGMQRPGLELIKKYMNYQSDNLPDSDEVKLSKRQIADDFRQQLIIGKQTNKDEENLRRLSSQLKNKKVCIKLYLREPLHAKLYLAYRPDDKFNQIQAIMGSSNLTYGGLNGQGELNAGFSDSDHAEKLARWFDDRWDDRFSLDISEELADIIDNSWAADKVIPPYYIYLKTAYHLSREVRNSISEFSLPSVFKKELLPFQETTVKLAARYLEKRNGAMIGDVVGLGKTITACAIAKVYELNYSCSTLILCPANLKEMWRKYVIKYDLKADILSIAKPVDEKHIRHYDLVIIDESHNLRNSTGVRYQGIKRLIASQNCKVLMLTATPYNMDFSDLANQLKLFLKEDADLGIQPEHYIRNIGGEIEFAKRHEDYIRSINAFEKSTEPDDWRELMRLFLIRRTRTFIKENYAKEDERNKRYLEFKDGTRSYFPERIPKSISFPTKQGDQFEQLYSEPVMDKMAQLRLPRYGLSRFLKDDLTSISASDQEIIANLSRAGQRMMGFCRTNFFKRMDSSGLSFLISLYRHILRNTVFIYAIDNQLPLPIGVESDFSDELLDDEDIENQMFDENQIQLIKIKDKSQFFFSSSSDDYQSMAEKYYHSLSTSSHNAKWLDSRFFNPNLKQSLIADNKLLLQIIDSCKIWDADKDEKLNTLFRLLAVVHPNEKIIVFTQYSDTAQYIFNQLKLRGLRQIQYVTGDTPNPTQIVELFSPVSNNVKIIPPIEEQLRVIIATDVLSEGQNLQDAHIVVNYDLPWAIIRLIQRAGRVDRIGQKADSVICYSFFPAEGVEHIIRLRRRLSDRINQNADIVGSDEIFFEGNEQNLLDIYNEKNGILDDDDDAEVDLSSRAFQIWKNATDANPQLKTIIPALSNVIYSTKQNNDVPINEGVITYAKTPNDNDMLIWMNTKGEVITYSQSAILKTMACNLDEPALPRLDNHHDLVAQSVEQINMQDVRIGGTLGRRFSTKYQVYTKLEKFCKNPDNGSFVTDSLKLAMDDIYNYPLQDNARILLNRQIKKGVSDMELAELVVELRNEDELSIKNNDVNVQQNKDPQIICSLGLRNI